MCSSILDSPSELQTIIPSHLFNIFLWLRYASQTTPTRTLIPASTLLLPQSSTYQHYSTCWGPRTWNHFDFFTLHIQIPLALFSKYLQNAQLLPIPEASSLVWDSLTWNTAVASYLVSWWKITLASLVCYHFPYNHPASWMDSSLPPPLGESAGSNRHPTDLQFGTALTTYMRKYFSQGFSQLLPLPDASVKCSGRWHLNPCGGLGCWQL